MTTREAATTISGSATSSELEMLAGLEAEMESLRNLAVDDTNWSNQFVSAVLGKEESHHQHTRNPRGHNGMGMLKLLWSCIIINPMAP